MQISITNGTLTNVSETLQPQANYDLPTTISVSGATSSYNSATGEVSLSSITSSVSITASGVFVFTPYMTIGNKAINNIYWDNNKVNAIYYGNIKVYDGVAYSYSQVGDELTINNAPYSLNGDELTIGE